MRCKIRHVSHRHYTTWEKVFFETAVAGSSKRSVITEYTPPINPVPLFKSVPAFTSSNLLLHSLQKQLFVLLLLFLMMMLSNLNELRQSSTWEWFTHQGPRLPLPAWRPLRLCPRTRGAARIHGCWSQTLGHLFLWVHSTAGARYAGCSDKCHCQSQGQ